MSAPVIVVGVDGSAGAAHALRWAVRFAREREGAVRAVMGWDYPALAVLPAPLGMPVPPPHEMDKATRKALRELVAPIADGTDVEITEVVRRGDGAQVVLAEAREHEADLVVVGSRGAGRVQSVLFGSVSRKVAASAPVPVVVVPERADLDATGPVVVGVDGSQASLTALRWAAEVTEGPIRAVHVFEYPFGPEYALPGFTWEDPEDLGHKLVEHAVAESLGDRPDVETSAVPGDPREVLAEASREASLVVVGARGATGLEGLILGSVTVELAARVHAPLAIIPPV
ncbi:MAG TPA: universal stress protein [Acidimicrobiales bacterium]|nr:universal stress protein [Acidimicrobiales bacterium]